MPGHGGRPASPISRTWEEWFLHIVSAALFYLATAVFASFLGFQNRPALLWISLWMIAIAVDVRVIVRRAIILCSKTPTLITGVDQRLRVLLKRTHQALMIAAVLLGPGWNWLTWRLAHLLLFQGGGDPRHR